MTKWVRNACIISFVAIISIGVWSSRRLSLAAEAGKEALNASNGLSNATSGPVQAVEVVKPQRVNMSRSLDVPATIEAIEQSDLYAKVSGYVADVKVDIGDHVKSGQVLATLDIPEMVNDLAEAKARVATWVATKKAADAALIAASSHVTQSDKALCATQKQLDHYKAQHDFRRKNFIRYDALIKEAAATQQQLDDAQAEADVAKADFETQQVKIAMAEADLASSEAGRLQAESQIVVAAAQVDLASAQLEKITTMMQYAQITAPFDGFITKRWIDRGALVQAATSPGKVMPLFNIQRIDTVKVFIEVPEGDMANIRAGTPAKVRPYASSKVFDGKVSRTSSALNPNTRTLRTEIDLTNADGLLFHGMYAQVNVEVDLHSNAITVPATAILTEGKEVFVFTVKDDHAVRTLIKTGLDDGIRIEATQGLGEDDSVIVTGKGLVTSGSAVKAVPKPGN